MCSLEIESFEPVCFKAFVEKSMEHLPPYKEVFKKKATDTDTKNFILI
jgi:hypothetical protein